MKFCLILLVSLFLLQSCGTNPYKESEKTYKTQLKTFTTALSRKESSPLPTLPKATISLDSTYLKQLGTYKDTLSKTTPTTLENVSTVEWIGTVNFNLRKPNFIIIHHTAQDSLQQTIKTFTLVKTQVSAHYIVDKNGHVVQMLNDYLRAWHAGASTWGKNTDINSCSIGIELDNNGKSPFPEAQINSLLSLLTKLKKDYNIPAQNIIGHADIAPSRKTDPSAFFPWEILAQKGFGIWPSTIQEPAPLDFNAEQGLRIIGYDTKNIKAAISAFKLHYLQTEVNDILDEKTRNTIYAVYQKQ